MHPERSVAWKALERTTARLELMETLMAADNGELSSEQWEAAREWEMELVTLTAMAQERLSKKMGRYYCDWRHWRIERGIYWWDFSYTLDTDGDGWYWWEVEKHKVVSEWAGMRTVEQVGKTQRGKRRKRKDAKAIVYKKYVDESNKPQPKERG